MKAEVFCLLNACGAEGTRTPDPHTASVVRYQLRHSPLPGMTSYLAEAPAK
jgi:hypothetical protein